MGLGIDWVSFKSGRGTIFCCVDDVGDEATVADDDDEGELDAEEEEVVGAAANVDEGFPSPFIFFLTLSFGRSSSSSLSEEVLSTNLLPKSGLRMFSMENLSVLGCCCSSTTMSSMSILSSSLLLLLLLFGLGWCCTEPGRAPLSCRRGEPADDEESGLGAGDDTDDDTSPPAVEGRSSLSIAMLSMARARGKQRWWWGTCSPHHRQSGGKGGGGGWWGTRGKALPNRAAKG